MQVTSGTDASHAEEQPQRTGDRYSGHDWAQRRKDRLAALPRPTRITSSAPPTIALPELGFSQLPTAKQQARSWQHSAGRGRGAGAAIETEGDTARGLFHLRST